MAHTGLMLAFESIAHGLERLDQQAGALSDARLGEEVLLLAAAGKDRVREQVGDVRQCEIAAIENGFPVGGLGDGIQGRGVDELAQRGEELAFNMGRRGDGNDRLEARPSIRLLGILMENLRPLDAAQEQVVSTAAELLALENAADAGDGMDRGFQRVIEGFEPVAQKGDGDQAASTKCVGHHIAIARLKNVQRNDGLGKQDHVGQWKHGNEL